MKRYRKYMDEIKAADDLRQRLRELEAPGSRPIPWKRYGAMAAVLVLVLGFGGLGCAYYYNTVLNPTGQAFLDATLAFDPAAHPDIAWEDPAESEPGNKTLGGYEYHEHEGVVTYRILPYIEYGEVEDMAAAADWDIPKGATRRDLSREEIIALMGGEDAVNTHLDWGEYELTGWAAWYEDGSFWGAYIDGLLSYVGGPASLFEFAVTAGQLPPTCFGYPDSVTQKVGGLTVTADKLDWSREFSDNQIHCYERRVSFMKDGCGYRFEMSSGSSEESEVLVSRLVCCVADERLALWTVDPGVGTYTCPECGKTLPVEGEKIHVHTYVDLGEVDPDAPLGVSAAPENNAPPVSVSGEPYVCTGYPTPDPAESWEVSDGHPLAPEGWTGSSDSGAVTDPDPGLTGSGELCGLPLAPGQHHEDHD